MIIAEILRSGVAALPRGQAEAAAIGLGQVDTMRIILLPQAFRIMLPAVISQIVVILKDTSLAAFIGAYVELLRTSNRIIADLGNPIQLYFVAGLIYIAINASLSYLAVRTERRLARGPRTRTAPPPDETALPATTG